MYLTEPLICLKAQIIHCSSYTQYVTKQVFTGDLSGQTQSKVPEKSDMSMRLESDAHNTQCITDNLARNKGKRRSECGVD